MPQHTGSQTNDATAPESGLADPAVETAHPPAVSDCEEVRGLAYLCWEARGCPKGSPEEDWFQAEQDLNARAGV
ncbi:MAG TPA: DUF2934 domain-containing protein [Bryobacteraceae bacterium]|nr:DUF2934 domain-containing protein [Bryobacteraceae bacterium]